MRSIRKISAENPEEIDHLGDLGIGGSKTLNFLKYNI